MAVYRRSRPPPIETENLINVNDNGASRKRSLLPGSQALLAIFFFVAVFALAAQQHAANDNRQASKSAIDRSSDNGIRTELAPGVSLRLDMARPEDDNAVTADPYTAEVTFHQLHEGCQSPRVWMRVIGDALIYIPMKSVDAASKWTGAFSFPMDGTYRIEIKWNDGCDTSLSSYTAPRNLTVTGNSVIPSILRKNLSSESIFQEGLWLSSSKFKIKGTNQQQPYIWHDPRLNINDATLLKASSSRGESLVSKEGSFIPDEFQNLSNYELVCWVGSQSAASIREAFLSVRPELFRQQRPFKFHYYNVSNFEKPDQYWDEELKKRFRKCKTILVSVDELEGAPVMQADYKRQVKTFLGHLVKAFNDETFPIWMITVNEPPMASSPMCTSPAAVPSSNHPCNDALFALWNEGSLPPRVKLLDTTDLVDPQFGENPKDIVAVIAMRIYTLVGHQVVEWRQRHNQIGKVNGLMRNGKVEPNPSEVPYDWTNT